MFSSLMLTNCPLIDRNVHHVRSHYGVYISDKRPSFWRYLHDVDEHDQQLRIVVDVNRSTRDDRFVHSHRVFVKCTE